jgi:hypothetical protein
VNSTRQPKLTITRNLLLRIGLCFFILFALFGGSSSLIALLPLIGSSTDAAIRRPMNLLVQWIGIHLFHLTGPAATFHVQSGGDAALQWIAIPVMLVLAILAGLLWSLLDKQHKDRELLGWLRLIVRLTLGVAMLRYGFIKVFPIQFPTPPLAVLNEPVGNASPTMLFWSLYGIRPHFVMLLGWTEFIAGVALLFRRTAFLGASLAFLVMANVALLDVTFNVPVKLYSLSLLVMAAVLLLPELDTILHLFLTRKPVVANQTWSPQTGRTTTQRLLLSVELLITLLACWQFATGTYAVWSMKQQSARNPPAFTGGWLLESGGQGLVGADGSPIVSIFFDPDSDVYFRATNGILWRSRAIYDRAHQRLRILYQVRGMLMFAIDQPDPNHLRLQPLGPTGADITPLTLTRIPLPTTYPLLQDRIRWITEFETLR